MSRQSVRKQSSGGAVGQHRSVNGSPDSTPSNHELSTRRMGPGRSYPGSTGSQRSTTQPNSSRVTPAVRAGAGKCVDPGTTLLLRLSPAHRTPSRACGLAPRSTLAPGCHPYGEPVAGTR